MTKKNQLPMHVRFFLPILNALKSLGGSATLEELKDAVVEAESLNDEQLEERLKNGMLRIDNQFAWSQLYLTRSGLLTISDDGVWSLTDEGNRAQLTETDVAGIFKKIHGNFVKQRKTARKPADTGEDEVTEDMAAHKVKLLDVLKSLSPAGFERICQRLLRASGFTRVKVTGRSGDGGIDGEGILEINPLVSMKVVFQAKRFKETVSSPVVRDFRGAMQGRAEKGIIITTGRFTQDAKKEAIREGVPPIELVDGDKLTEMFEQRKLGLRERTVYEIDEAFFDEYR